MFAYVLLAASLWFAINHPALIQNEPNSQLLPDLGNVGANRPIGSCVPTGSVPRQHHGGGNCLFNFTLSLSQESLTQVQGSSSLAQLSLTLISGVSVPVTLSAQGVPVGTDILFALTSAKPSFSLTMTIETSARTPLGQFNITILAIGGGLEKSTILSLLVVPIVHDIAVVSALVQGTATVGSSVSINATVANYGSVSEAFELRAYANTSLVAELSGLRLAPSATYTGRFMWNTTGFLPGTYNVLVTVPPVQGELNRLDNTREAGKTLLTTSPGSQPGPSPAASGGVQGFNYGRQLAVGAAIAEAAIVFLVILRSKRKASTGPSEGPRKV